MALESSQGKLQFQFRLHSNRRSKPKDMSSQSFKTLTRDSFRTPPWESQEKEPFGCNLHPKLQRIIYGGRWWLLPSPGRGESNESKCPWLVLKPKGAPECELTFLWLVLDADLSEIILVPLPSLVSGLLACPSTPFQCWKSRTALKSQLSAIQRTWTLKWVQQGTLERITVSQACLGDFAS